MDFDPGSDTDTVSSLGSSDAFILKLDSAGKYVWSKVICGSDWEEGITIISDKNNNLFITGVYSGTTDFNPSSRLDTLSSIGGNDVFICKFDTAGNFKWVKNMGGAATDQANSMFIDKLGHIYVTGIFEGTCDFDPGAAIDTITPAGIRDIFISKLDSNGSFVWAKNIGGGKGYNFSSTIRTDDKGNVYTCGSFEDIVNFNPGIPTDTLSSNGSRDIFISKLDSQGNFICVKRMGGTGDDMGLGLAIDASNNIITTGYFNDKVDFDPSSNIFNLTSSGDNDIFISKLEQCYSTIITQPTSTTVNVSSIAIFSISVSSATATFQWQENTGSGFTNLSNNSQYAGVTSDTLFINNVSLQHNNYTYRCLITHGTCMDTSNYATLTATCVLKIITNPNSMMYFVDSTATFIVSASSTKATFQWQENMGSGFINLFSNSGQYFGVKNDTLYVSNLALSQNNNKYRCIIKENGCADTSTAASLNVKCNLTVKAQPINQTVNVGDTVRYSVTSLNQKSTFQWQQNSGTGFINLSNFGQFSGVNTDTLTIRNIKKNQDNYGYRCLVINGACIDSSIGATLTVINPAGIDNLSDNNSIIIYPNPASGVINIANKKSQILSLNIYNTLGELVCGTIYNNHAQLSIDLSGLPKGLYFIKVGDDTQRFVLE